MSTRLHQPAPTLPGRPLPGSAARAELVALLKQDASDYAWVAATVGANNAAGYQLATGDPAMPIGGFNGSDLSPTLAQLQQYVREGRIHLRAPARTRRAPGRPGEPAALARTQLEASSHSPLNFVLAPGSGLGRRSTVLRAVSRSTMPSLERSRRSTSRAWTGAEQAMAVSPGVSAG
jgi:hypothetical protein